MFVSEGTESKCEEQEPIEELWGAPVSLLLSWRTEELMELYYPQRAHICYRIYASNYSELKTTPARNKLYNRCPLYRRVCQSEVGVDLCPSSGFKATNYLRTQQHQRRGGWGEDRTQWGPLWAPIRLFIGETGEHTGQKQYTRKGNLCKCPNKTFSPLPSSSMW